MPNTTTVIPVVAVHEIYSGNTFTGVASDGTHSLETIDRGRVQKWIGGTVGGEFDSPSAVGMKVEQVFWSIDSASAPDVTIYLVDDDLTEYQIYTLNSKSSSYVNANYGFFVPPEWKVRVKSSQAVNSVIAVAGEDTGITGDGTTDTYSIQFAHGRVDPATVSLVAGSVTFTDAGGDGILTGTGGSGGSGTINYLTGLAEITLTAPSDFNASNALATYDYNRIGRVGIIMQKGWGQPVFSKIATLGSENLPPSIQP